MQSSIDIVYEKKDFGEIIASIFVVVFLTMMKRFLS